MKRVLLDVDTGIDDALAILLALKSPRLQVVAITTVAGNVEVELATANTMKVLELAGRGDIPVAMGSPKPLMRPLNTATGVHGKDGLGNTNLPPASLKPIRQHATDLIIDLVMSSPDEITLIQTAPLTNLALALWKEPRLAETVHQVIIMGGAIRGPGNVRPRAEFNIFTDPEAARFVFWSGIPIILVPLDVTSQVVLTQEALDNIAGGQVADFAKAIASYYLKWSIFEGLKGAPLHDPLAVGVAIHPTWVKTKRVYVDIETKGELTTGETVGDLRPYRTRGNASVCLEVDADRFINMFIKSLTG